MLYLVCRCNQLEKQLLQARDDEDYGLDVEEGNGSFSSNNSSSTSSGGTMALRRRGNGYDGAKGSNRTNLIVNDLEKMGVKPAEGVAKAVSMIDSWTLLTGRLVMYIMLCVLVVVMCLVQVFETLRHGTIVLRVISSVASCLGDVHFGCAHTLLGTGH